jgi:hypothetical protein
MPHVTGLENFEHLALARQVAEVAALDDDFVTNVTDHLVLLLIEAPTSRMTNPRRRWQSPKGLAARPFVP